MLLFKYIYCRVKLFVTSYCAVRVNSFSLFIAPPNSACWQNSPIWQLHFFCSKEKQKQILNNTQFFFNKAAFWYVLLLTPVSYSCDRFYTVLSKCAIHSFKSLCFVYTLKVQYRNQHHLVISLLKTTNCTWARRVNKDVFSRHQRRFWEEAAVREVGLEKAKHASSSTLILYTTYRKKSPNKTYWSNMKHASVSGR